ncbi:MAG TPA: CNNM domain-containing protein, partial [Nonomuraea sp.]|nr:CNNM domain-containing protein [Nonomuraea sp.]
MNVWLLSAIALVIVGGLIAGAETALTRISRVRAEEFARDARRGAARLRAIVTDPPRYLNLLLLLRLSCELVATVIATLLFIDLLDDQGWAYVWAAA